MSDAQQPVRSTDWLSDLTDLLRECGAVPHFWVCPKGCRGRVVWAEGCSDATCMVCGTKRSDNSVMSDKSGGTTNSATPDEGSH